MAAAVLRQPRQPLAVRESRFRFDEEIAGAPRMLQGLARRAVGRRVRRENLRAEIAV